MQCTGLTLCKYTPPWHFLELIQNNALSPHGIASNFSSALAMTMAGNGNASLHSPITSTPQGNTPGGGAAVSCHSMMTPISPVACLPGSGSNESSLQWSVAGGTALNGGLGSVQQPGVPVNSQGFITTTGTTTPTITPLDGGGGGQESLARSTDTANGYGGFDWRARRMMDVARNSIRGAAARLMMKLHLAGQKVRAHLFYYHHPLRLRQGNS